MRYSYQIRLSSIVRPLVFAVAALVCGGGMQAAPVKAKARTVARPAVKKSPVRKSAVKRRARVRRAVARPVKPNPLLIGVTPLSPLLAPQFPPMLPPPPISGTCFRCSDPLLATAYSLLGVRYRLGGSSPEYGFDCSGFTRYTYERTLNLTLPSSAPLQYRVGVAVDKKELVPGDLVFFRPRKRGWHVGIYVGDDSFIHAPNRRRTVSVSPLSDPYWKRAFIGARRVVAAPLEEPTMMELSTNN